jgi:hypothetical protein
MALIKLTEGHCKALGIARPTVRSYIKDGRIKGALIGRGYWIDDSVLPAGYIESGDDKPIEEEEEEREPTPEEKQLTDIDFKIALERRNQEYAAMKCHYATVEDYRKAQDELVINLEQVAKDKAQNEADRAQIVIDQEVTKQAHQAEVDEIAREDTRLQDDVKKARETLTNILKNFDQGPRYLLEKAARILTTPEVYAAEEVTFHGCTDCLVMGTDNIDHDVHISTTFKLQPCKNCQQTKSRVLPYSVCQLCPLSERLKEVSGLIIQTLIASGVKPEYTEEKTYKPTIIGEDKKRELTLEQRVNLIMRNFGVENKEGG